MSRPAVGDLSAESKPTRYFVDTNVLGIVASRTHRMRTAYLDLISSEEFDALIPSVSVIVVIESSSKVCQRLIEEEVHGVSSPTLCGRCSPVLTLSSSTPQQVR